MRKQNLVAIALLVIGLGTISVIVVNRDNQTNTNTAQNSENLPSDIPSSLQRQFDTDFSNSSLDNFSEVISGGPPKDGIPAISNPKFELITTTSIADNVQAIYVNIDDQEKVYPYNILVHHEIVNDEVGGKKIAATFCPLCGTGIVYDRKVDDRTLEFGVSGFLRESNMIMYDRQTESLWQQTTGESFVGQLNTKKLELIPFQLLSIREIKDKFPNSQIMSTNTGHSRDYERNPYGSYDENDQFIFSPSMLDERYPAKELFYVVRANEKSVALKFKDMGESAQFNQNGINLTAQKDGSEITVFQNGEVLPGYYEMWFSWASWHQDDGLVWQP